MIKGQPGTSPLGIECALQFFLAVAHCLKVGDSRVTHQLTRRREEGGFYAAAGARLVDSKPRGNKTNAAEDGCNTNPPESQAKQPQTQRTGVTMAFVPGTK